MEVTRYTPEEILQILNDQYHCQAVFDPEVDEGDDLTFATTIQEWRDTCDLIDPKSLAKVEHRSFQLATPVQELEIILSTETTTLLGFCRYISDHAVKLTVSPVMSLGTPCMSAAIFKTLTANLKERGVDVQHIRPSSKLAPIFNKHGGILLTEVSKFAPGAFTKFEYEQNRISRTGGNFILLFLLSIIVVPFVWHFHWMLLLPLGIGILLWYIGSKFPPAKEVIGGYYTLRELVMAMQARM
ncbi:hypothetical protein [Mucilaginibacter myungsuensis]|uniref:Uncharacterized protein n=1 Tax=Mucilaginibacter myungsuensis TaxID=649104 RepID=A0A929KUW5_9SPHI|nr:hypothetical protein [Mucilaginibacter myungsuensis]MBE9662021.1 hypothetical protein [Mucilaginibacter myungsuensis]MDN3599546.1 hypothetical protein [Mucilaginibacter myungsuensis]